MLYRTFQTTGDNVSLLGSESRGDYIVDLTGYAPEGGRQLVAFDLSLAVLLLQYIFDILRNQIAHTHFSYLSSQNES